MHPLLARGRDRLETWRSFACPRFAYVPYSLGDAIDWKRMELIGERVNPFTSPTR